MALQQVFYDFHVYLRRLLVEQPAYPGVVDERLRRRLELHVAIDSAPAVHGAEEALARRHVVLHLCHDRRVRTGRHEVRHVVLVRAAVVVHERHLPVVHPEPAHGLHAAASASAVTTHIVMMMAVFPLSD